MYVSLKLVLKVIRGPGQRFSLIDSVQLVDIQHEFSGSIVNTVKIIGNLYFLLGTKLPAAW